MKKLIFLIIIYLSMFSPASYSQIDSLDKVISSNAPNSEKIKALIQSSRSFVNVNPDTVDVFLSKLLLLSEKENDIEGLVAYEMFNGLKWSRLGDFEKSNEYLFKAIEAGKNKPEIKYIYESYMLIGINYSRLGLYDTAAEYLHKSIDLSKKYKHLEIVASSYITLSIVYKDLEQYDKAVENLIKAENIAKENNYINTLSTVYANLANIHKLNNESDKQLFYLDKNIEFALSTNDLYSLSVAYHNKAAYFYDQENIDETINYLNKSIEIKEQMNDKIGIALSQYGLSEVYADAGQYDLAIKTIMEAIEVFEETKSTRQIMLSYYTLSWFYSEINNFEKANEYLLKHIEVKDNLFNESREKIVAELNAKYELAEKDKENQILQNKSDRQKFIIVIVITAITTVSLLLFFVVLKNRAISKLNKKLEVNRKHVEEQNEEFDLLNKDLQKINQELQETNAMKDKFFTIVAHDLKNPISGHYMVIELLLKEFHKSSEEEKLHLLDMLKESSKNTYNLLENLLTWSRTQMGKIKFHKSIFELNGLVENVFGIVKASFSFKDIDYINEVKPEIEVEGDLNMLSTIIRNIVTNSVKFTNPGGKIIVSAEIHNKELILISITDTGVGMTQAQIDNLFRIGSNISTNGTNDEKGTGLGLIIVKEFIDNHNGKIWVESTVGKGSKFNILLNKNS